MEPLVKDRLSVKLLWLQCVHGTELKKHHPTDLWLVSSYFEPSQPQRIISRRKRNFSLSPGYFAHKSSDTHTLQSNRLTTGAVEYRLNHDCFFFRRPHPRVTSLTLKKRGGGGGGEGGKKEENKLMKTVT